MIDTVTHRHTQVIIPPNGARVMWISDANSVMIACRQKYADQLKWVEDTLLTHYETPHIMDIEEYKKPSAGEDRYKRTLFYMILRRLSLQSCDLEINESLFLIALPKHVGLHEEYPLDDNYRDEDDPPLIIDFKIKRLYANQYKCKCTIRFYS